MCLPALKKVLPEFPVSLKDEQTDGLPPRKKQTRLSLSAYSNCAIRNLGLGLLRLRAVGIFPRGVLRLLTLASLGQILPLDSWNIGHPVLMR
jgi:hypothetical protein